jgi:hypothetical protein
VLSGAQCLQTPDGTIIARAGEGAVVQQGPPMRLSSVGKRDAPFGSHRPARHPPALDQPQYQRLAAEGSLPEVNKGNRRSRRARGMTPELRLLALHGRAGQRREDPVVEVTRKYLGRLETTRMTHFQHSGSCRGKSLRSLGSL